MKISRLTIKNLRSLHNIELADVDNLCILLGKNSSGKSNILEGLSLFFTDFALTGGTSSGLNDYFWFNRIQNEPIEFTVEVKFSDEECENAFPDEILGIMKARFPESYNKLLIQRKIVNLQGTWYTKILEWSGISLVKDDKPLTPADVSSAWNSLGSEGKKTDEHAADSTNPPTKIPPPQLAITPEMLSKVFTKIVQKVKAGFGLVSAIRDVKNPVPYRNTLVDSQVQSSLWALDQSVSGTEEDKYAEIETAFRSTTGLQLDPVQGQIFVRKGTRRFPLYLEGGGIQSAINLVFTLKSQVEKGCILALEEPETHSHPELQRKLFIALKEISKDGQLFISTHSPIFVDRADLSNVWVVKIANGETTVSRLRELKEAIDELGAKPSDVLFSANKVILVEGKSEEIVLPAFAKRLGIDLTDVAIIPVEGKSKARFYLDAWVQVARNAVPLFVVLDSDSSKEVQELIAKKLISQDEIHLWQKGTIEDYYPADLLKTALDEINERYSLGLNMDAIMDEIQKGRLHPTKINVGKKASVLPKSLKVLVAESIAKLVAGSETRLPDEVERVLHRALR